MSQINVDTVRNRTSTNGGPTFDKGLTVSAGTTAYVYGNLQVDGTETIVNTERLDVADKTVGIASTTAASNSTADGAGIEVYGGAGGNKTITWVNSTSNWTLGGGGLTADSAIVGSAVTINGSGIKAGIITANDILRIGTNSVTASTSGDDLTIEGASDRGLSIISGSSSSGNIYFGDSADADIGRITYQHNDNALEFYTNASSTSNAVITSAGNLGIGTGSPSAFVSLLKSGGNAKLQLQRSNAASNTDDYGSVLWRSMQGTAVGGINVARQTAEDDGYMFFQTASGGTLAERMRITKTGGLSLNNGELVERCYINSTAWSTNGDINLDNGMVQYNSANLAGTNNTLNITSSVGINTQLATGDMISVTAITAVNATSAYVNHITIDHIAVTENWVGGSAPTAGGGSGLDTYAFNIIKTGSATYKVIANHVKTS